MCIKLFAAGDHKMRDHGHVTGKFTGSAHWICSINLKWTKKVTLIFHKLKGCDSHMIMEEIGNVDVKISITPNGLENYMAFTINENLFSLTVCNL